MILPVLLDASSRAARRARLVTAAFALTLFTAPALHPQNCPSNPNVGCTKAGAPCSPVVAGTTGAGHCKTPPGFPKGERSCECDGTPDPPPPLIDPGCSDITARGTFSCTIEQPNVTQHETQYPAIVFGPGDIVEVNANGCVQTGGFGSTWKRYVNPTGDNSDRLYHGLIRIPNSKAANLVRIQSVISNPFKVNGVGSLSLGYEDDGYSDNGYGGHDNGIDNQCQTDPTKSFDGEPAHVTITISRGVPPPPPTSTFDFDVLWSQEDPNGLPYNPQWSWQLNPQNGSLQTPHVPDTSICHNFSSRSTFLGIPDSTNLDPDFVNCTDQADQTTVDTPSGSNANVCNEGLLDLGLHGLLNNSFVGHVNWFPVTMEGSAKAPNHSADDDYTFEFIVNSSSAPLSVNGADGLHVEFDSDETIDNFTSPEWTAIHHAVDSDSAEAARLFAGHAILTGMFGLDGEHDLKSEIHPLYALAIKRDNYENDPKDEVWLMFVRNQGDEGYCSSQIWNSGFQDYTFRLPWHEGMTSVDVNWDKTINSFDWSVNATGPAVASIAPPSPDAGVYVTFHLGPAVPRQSNIVGDPGATIPFVDGALHLTWSNLSSVTSVQGTKGTISNSRDASPLQLAPSVAVANVAKEIEVNETEQTIGSAIAKLPTATQTLVKNARQTPVTKPIVRSHTQPARSVRRLAQPPDTPKVGTLHAIKAGPASRKLQRDAAQMRALCAASNNAPVGLPPKACATK